MRKIIFALGLLGAVVAAGWASRQWTTMTVKARVPAMNDDIENLFVGLQQYKENVGAWPVGSNADIVKALKGQNPKNVIILVGRKLELNSQGEFVDPWGTALRIYFGGNNILIRSAGPNKRFDDSTSPECDDYLRSN